MTARYVATTYVPYVVIDTTTDKVVRGSFKTFTAALKVAHKLNKEDGS